MGLISKLFGSRRRQIEEQNKAVVEGLRKSLAEVSGKKSELERMLGETQAENQRLQGLYEEQRSQRNEIGIKYLNLETEHIGFKKEADAEINAKEAQLIQMQAELKKLEEEYDTITKQKQAAEEETKTLRGKSSSLKDTAYRLEQKLAEKNQQIEQHEKNAAKEKKDYMRKVSDIIGELTQNKAVLEKSAKEIVKLQSALKKAEEDYRIASEGYSRLEQQLKTKGKKNGLREGNIITATVYEKVVEKGRKSGYHAMCSDGVIYVRTAKELRIGQEIEIIVISVPYAMEARIISNILPENGKKYTISFERYGETLSAVCRNGIEVTLLNAQNSTRFEENVTGFEGEVMLEQKEDKKFYARRVSKK